MKINKAELCVACDIDNTLIMHRQRKIDDMVVLVTDPYDGDKKYFSVHQEHLKLIKDYHKRGYQITVWSHNGWAWAEAVCIALDIQDIVYEVRTKFIKHVDDTEADIILGPRVYIPESRS